MLVGSISILMKKFTSRGPVYPIPIPTNLLSIQDRKKNLEKKETTNQSMEAMELGTIARISRIINGIPVNDIVEPTPCTNSIITSAQVNENLKPILSISQLVNEPVSITENVETIDGQQQNESNQNGIDSQKMNLLPHLLSIIYAQIM